MRAIGYARTPYKERFGTPRQPQVTSGGVLGGVTQEGVLHLNGLDEERARLSLRGLSGFSHVWAIFSCHLNTGWSALIQPPRGPRNNKQGVFATRSPNRPNQIGLSLLRLLRVDEDACTVHFVGGDLIDGTPILDIKPYIAPYDSVSDARHGWLDEIANDIVGEADVLSYHPPPPSLFETAVCATVTESAAAASKRDVDAVSESRCLVHDAVDPLAEGGRE